MQSSRLQTILIETVDSRVTGSDNVLTLRSIVMVCLRLEFGGCYASTGWVWRTGRQKAASAILF
ncbi:MULTISPECIES: hypothetical protein [unclassified Coleofasciculus]|uniref:hypothetical protein n=1 Tax=Cyanophyceae TaxID=3028117 RepID=UPI0016846713|nr:MULTISPECIES: hypothetical protein [unclassified Coleofasciculus]MBD1889637.1 hypothetical protein [Coleofasciculus sp. FACHB-SPT9]MBD2083721.1 hypothetical protein [Coleofasciculus sp. FACHB-542]